MSDLFKNPENGTEKALNDLYRKINITAETRFHASRRLNKHAETSLKLNVFISVAFILLSVLQLMEFGVYTTTPGAVFFQVSGAMLILIFSIISSFKDYKGASEKYYSCASELVDLKRKVYEGMLMSTDSYSVVAKEYGDILNKYETHTAKDFRSDHTRALVESSHKKDAGRIKRCVNDVKWRVGYIVDFLFYYFAVALLVPMFYLIVFGPTVLPWIPFKGDS
ncbi:SLATT domain-containing protein [Vreelandella alkaliphila]|uniref:SLATT domain-containing protein n=1 Tax=Vreelandella alkaliphila TaxID=272774 RepID=UPI003FD8EC0B